MHPIPPRLFCLHEDSNANAALFDNGRLYAVAEERLSRRRFQGGFPWRCVAWLERTAGERAK